MPRQNVENDVGGMDAVGEGFGAGCLDSRQAVITTADSTLTIGSPSSEPFSLRRMRSKLAGKSQSLKVSAVSNAPGFLASTGT